VELEAVVVAIKRRTKHLLVILPLGAFMLIAYQNCAVDMAPTTPGAASVSCNPTAQQLADFEAIFNNDLNATGNFTSGAAKCASCHGTTLNPNGEGGYTIYQGDTTTDTTLVKKNFCIAEGFGATLVDHPMSGSHGGGMYPQSDISDLVTFVRANF